MSKEKHKKTNALRILDTHKIPYSISEYEWSEAVSYTHLSNEYNDETVWVEKIGEARLDTHTYHVGNSPITVRGGINAGYWKEGSVKGSHKEYYAEVSHDPIKLGKNADLRFLGGYQRDYYGYDGSKMCIRDRI